ncbi:hypothetical protein ACP3VZ_03865 [Vibrio sp. PNB22_2_2]|uniref:hypothetical protein n=1 Tax=unclassified Vibrio TaxID=2614977 RepID=UPI00406A5824
MGRIEGNIIAEFGQWVVTDLGIECNFTYYFIDKERLNEPDWVEHVSKKTWVNKGEFVAAFKYALSIHCP